ncbi:MAG: cob(I)yrinic acid a,c-diamide adenosyltransferase [Betaproteobacteria bacterium]|nr:cob(I)yrinic acid a,c-diamide adenosyltransferase [Betaproteobacteria bacterium]
MSWLKKDHIGAAFTSNLLACNLWLYQFLPFLKWQDRITRDNLKADGLSGATGALIVLPQAVAFATIAGLPPEYGLYAAMIPTIIAALFGSSWHLVSGPTTAISIVVFASVSPYAEPGTPQYIGMVLTLTFLTGLFQLIMGLAKMGALVNFISHTVVIGFTAGAALLIAASQVKNFFGLEIPRGAPAYEVVGQLLTHLHDINVYVTGVAVISLVAGILARKYLRQIPYMIVAMVVGGLVAAWLNSGFGAEATGIRTVGALVAGFPPLSAPDFSLAALKNTFFSALAVTVLALTEAVSISRSVAVKSEQHINGNQEFIGQGLSNLAGSFFSGYASSGSFNRTGVNFESGARTPLAAVFSSVFLLAALFLVAPLAAYLPIPAMAAVLFMVAWNLIDFHHIGAILKAHREEAVVLGVSFFGTVIDLEKGIFFGILTSLVYYLSRTSRPAIRAVAPDPEDRDNPRRKFVPETGVEPECPQLKMLRIEGSIFFGAVEHIQHAFVAVDEHVPTQRHLLLFSKGINTIDLAGAELLSGEAKRRRRLGGALYLCGVREAACDMLKNGGYQADIGAENVFAHKPDALAGIYPRLDVEQCRTCRARIFRECRDALPDGTQRPAEERAVPVQTAPAYQRLTEIVTRTGDDGSTGLANGVRLDKHHPRIEAIGQVDELNSAIGVLLAQSLDGTTRGLLTDIQHDLFNLGAELAWPEQEILHADALLRLDDAVARLNSALPPLSEFVLPGGVPAAAQAHVCRTLCRRAERRLTRLAEQELLSTRLVQYLNRLSDLMFVLSRTLNRKAGQAEPVWKGR